MGWLGLQSDFDGVERILDHFANRACDRSIENVFGSFFELHFIQCLVVKEFRFKVKVVELRKQEIRNKTSKTVCQTVIEIAEVHRVFASRAD